MGDAQRQDGIPERLSPEYPTGTHGALVDVFCGGMHVLLKLLLILRIGTNHTYPKLGLPIRRAQEAPSFLLFLNLR